MERRRAYARDAVWYRYTRKANATGERRRAYARDAVGNRYARQIPASCNCIVIYKFCIIMYRKACDRFIYYIN